MDEDLKTDRMRVTEIDWSTWQPHDVATLMFVFRPGEVLLIRKLRGLGKGKINAPGGRAEPGEALIDAAVRETVEEVGVRPIAPRTRGVLRFEFTDGYRLECHVFSAEQHEGEAHESDEAIPLWTPLAAIPYGEMWADDRLWIPLMLSGRTPFSGRFVFDRDELLDAAIEAVDPALALFARLDELGIAHETHAHVPVFTVEEARRHRPPGDGLHTKNLFVRDKKGRMWLITVEAERRIDLCAIGEMLSVGRLSFATPERLRRYLGVEPGSVTPFSVMNDPAGEVTVVLDRVLAESPAVWIHPLTNDRTTRIAGSDLVRFLEASGHAPIVLELPGEWTNR